MTHRLINYILSRIYQTVRVTEVITSDKGKIKLGGKPITASELKQLQAEVKALMGFRVWGLMTNTVRRLAEDKIIKQSTNFDEVVAGKLMLINLDTIESIATVIKHSV